MGAAVQLVLLRELMAAFGGNEFSAGVTVAVWVLCEAFGAWLAGRGFFSVSDALLSTLSILSSLAAVPAATLLRPLLGVLPGEALSVPLLLFVTFVAVSLPAGAHGALFVAATALHAERRTSGAVGVAYTWEGLGAVLASLACLPLLGRLPSLSPGQSW